MKTWFVSACSVYFVAHIDCFFGSVFDYFQVSDSFFGTQFALSGAESFMHDTRFPSIVDPP